nr:hypothetical protein [Nonomuraea sp. FMUSA5-5]
MTLRFGPSISCSTREARAYFLTVFKARLSRRAISLFATPWPSRAWMAAYRLRVRRAVGPSSRALACGDVAKAAPVGQGEFLDGLAEIVEQVPAIGALHRLRRAVAGTGRVRGRAVPADELDPGMLLQPVGEGDAEPIGQHLHAAMRDGIDDDRGIAPASLDREVVDADRRRNRRRRLRQRHQGAEYADAAEQQPDRSQEGGSARPASASAHAITSAVAPGVRRP